MDQENEILAYLDAHSIRYERHTHGPVYTCAEAEVAWPGLQGASIKNLFLQSGQAPESRRYLLAVTACERRLNLKALGRALGLRERLTFGSPEALLEVLGVTPGAVTALALVNDPAGQVQVVFDREIWEAPAFLFHPLVNTSTLVIAQPDLRRFLQITGHDPIVTAMA